MPTKEELIKIIEKFWDDAEHVDVKVVHPCIHKLLGSYDDTYWD